MTLQAETLARNQEVAEVRLKAGILQESRGTRRYSDIGKRRSAGRVNDLLDMNVAKTLRRRDSDIRDALLSTSSFKS